MVSKNLYTPLSLSNSVLTRWLMCFFSLVLLITLSINATAGLVFSEDFEKAGINKSSGNKGWNKQTCDDKAIMPVKAGQFGAPAPRTGKLMLRTRSWPAGKPQKCNGNSRIRTELIGNVDIPPNEERWIGFSTYIPKSGGIRGEKPVAFFQLHYGAVRPRQNHELFYIEASQGKYNLLHNVGSPERRQKVGISSVDYNTWTDWVIHLKFTQPSSKKVGYVKIWKNGKLVFDKKGHSLRNTTNISPARKIGMYVHQGWSRNKSIKEMVIYHDAYRIGDQNSSYKEVSPGGKNPGKDPVKNPGKDIKLPASPTGVNVVKQ